MQRLFQYVIPPGQYFTYAFPIDDQRRTFWWHAHLAVQSTDGAYGPLIIHDLDEMVPETEEERVLFMSGVYHTYGSVERLRPRPDAIPSHGEVVGRQTLTQRSGQVINVSSFPRTGSVSLTTR